MEGYSTLHDSCTSTKFKRTISKSNCKANMLYETSYIRKERIKLNPLEMTGVIPTEDKLRDIIHQVVWS